MFPVNMLFYLPISVCDSVLTYFVSFIHVAFVHCLVVVYDLKGAVDFTLLKSSVKKRTRWACSGIRRYPGRAFSPLWSHLGSIRLSLVSTVGICNLCWSSLPWSWTSRVLLFWSFAALLGSAIQRCFWVRGCTEGKFGRTIDRSSSLVFWRIYSW